MIPPQDKLSRPIKDLRISVIDRCNFRCTYCMPAKDFPASFQFLRQDQLMTHGEIVRLVHVLSELGVEKVRLTGGEPLLRPNLHTLVKDISNITSIKDIALTTNGVLLTKYAKDLYDAGLQRITVSLDALDIDTLTIMSGIKADLNAVLGGLDFIKRLPFQSIKVNAVIKKGLNDHSVLELAEQFRKTSIVLRFIEYMDVGNTNDWDLKHVFSSRDILKMLNAKYPLEALDEKYYGEVARRYRYKDGAGEIGFISSISEPFCRSCTRLRLSADGKLYPCLFSDKGLDILKHMRRGVCDKDLIDIVVKFWESRDDRYSEERQYQSKKTSKVEMFKMGG